MANMLLILSLTLICVRSCCIVRLVCVFRDVACVILFWGWLGYAGPHTTTSLFGARKSNKRRHMTLLVVMKASVCRAHGNAKAVWY